MSGLVHKMLDRVFGTAEEINGAHRCPTYLYRWTVRKTAGGKWYLHKFVGDDWSLDFHDHPKEFTSIGLWGSYLEATPAGTKRWRAPWFRRFPAEHKHRITTPWGTCWALVIVGKSIREWGFWHDGKLVPWREYVASDAADEMKACPVLWRKCHKK